MITAVLDFLGVPHENGFFAKDMDPKPYFTEGWEDRVYEKFREVFPEPILIFYINHLRWELLGATELYRPACPKRCLSSAGGVQYERENHDSSSRVQAVEGLQLRPLKPRKSLCGKQMDKATESICGGRRVNRGCRDLSHGKTPMGHCPNCPGSSRCYPELVWSPINTRCLT